MNEAKKKRETDTFAMNNRKQIHRIKVIEFSKCAAFISFAMDLISRLLFYVQFYGAAVGMHILALTPTNERKIQKKRL